MVETSKKDEANPSGEKVKRNWADVDDEGDDEGTQKDIGGSGPVAQVPNPKDAENQQPKIVPPRTKREKNIYGDFIVTKLNVKDKVVPKEVVNPDEEESEEEEDSEPESDQKDEEEVKKPEPVKKLSKKEQKQKEQEEFESLMNEMGVKDAPSQKEEKKAEVPETKAKIDEKKQEANRKKKEKQKAKKAEEAKKAQEEKKEQAELTEEERAAAIAEAIKKRQGKSGANGLPIDAAVAQSEAASRKGKQGTKKNASGYGR